MPKSGGSIRLCVDYRKVNEVETFDAFPMLQIDDTIQKISQARYISTHDLTKGYWQIPMAHQDREKMAFSTAWGLFQFKCMPFGLHGTAASFQHLMDKFLAPHECYAAAYIDNIIFFSEN